MPPLRAETKWERIREARENAGLNKNQLARRVGVNQVTGWTWEAEDEEHRKDPNAANTAKIARVTGYTYEDIEFGSTGEAQVQIDVHPSLQALRDAGEIIEDEDFAWLARLDMKDRNPTPQDYLWLLRGRRNIRRADDEATAVAEESARKRGGRKLR